MNYPSIHLENAVQELTKLPSVGRRTALRYALYLLSCDNKAVEDLAQSILNLKKEVKICKECYSISDEELCEICRNNKRDKSIVCVVESVRDVMAIESTNSYNGTYHVLQGVISPIEGIGAKDLTIEPLIRRVVKNSIKEVILALPTTMEGDTTCFYINRLLKDVEVKVSVLARGVSIGDNIEYTDQITLSRSIANRLPFENIYSNN